MARIFDQIVGHQSVQERLLEAMAADRFPSTLLLAGPSGVGKVLLARALAQALVCENHRRACGLCSACERIDKGESEDLLHISSSNGAPIKMEQAHEIRSFLHLQVWGRARVVLIEDAHHLNSQAANALLKSLEEPPEKTFYILTATNAHRLLSTIRSRCQVIRIGLLSRSELQSLGEAENWMLESSMGRMDILNQLRDPEIKKQRTAALGVFGQMGERSPLDLGRETMLIGGDREGALRLSQWFRQLFRDALFYREGLTPLIHSDFPGEIEKLSQLGSSALHWLHGEILELEEGLRRNWDRQLAWEVFFIRASEAVSANSSGRTSYCQ